MENYRHIIWVLLYLSTILVVLLNQQAASAEPTTVSAQLASTSDNAGATSALLTDPSLLEALHFILEESIRKPTPPVRRNLEGTVAPAPPEVPGYLEDASPLTAKVIARRGGDAHGGQVARVISRGKDRIHVLFENQDQEWLFIRNPRDGRRVLGQLIDHRKKVILEYPEAELADSRVARGWVDVIAIGVSPERLAVLEATGERKKHNGILFERYVAPASEEKNGLYQEVWWSHDEALPLKIVSAEGKGELVQEVVDVRHGVDPAVLRNPQERYPTYLAMDMVDWREEHQPSDTDEDSAHHHGHKH